MSFHPSCLTICATTIRTEVNAVPKDTLYAIMSNEKSTSPTAVSDTITNRNVMTGIVSPTDLVVALKASYDVLLASKAKLLASKAKLLAEKDKEIAHRDSQIC